MPTDINWSTWEWLLRLSLCTFIVLRIATLVLQNMKPSHLIQMLGLALLMLNSAGAGFYWLEPNVHSYANGVWLAFTTIATVGYGDIVPSTPASKIFAVFIVLLGYAIFSIVTANIAALFVEAEEAGFERELHADIRALTREVACGKNFGAVTIYPRHLDRINLDKQI
ncbi:potassium channel family protein [Undibacterium sp. TJN19]|uniref:potassium channel family protein n=1 Tax=Undibacterium sp. TJN19 TaxID=3413055 RepID=UPI003BF33A32